MSGSHKATLIGLSAVILWSSIVGLIRGVSESFGPVGGAAMIYSVASLLLLVTLGGFSIRKMPRAYLLWGGLLFVAYELCLSLSLGYANDGKQAIEVSMVNYLWPTFTIIFAMFFNNLKANFLIIPGVLCSMLGISWVLGGEHGLDIPQMLANIRSNPLSYGLAFTGAVLWAAYCSVTARIAGGKNSVTLFFIMVSVVLWLKYLVTDGETMHFSYQSCLYLVLAAAAIGFGYAAWNVGIRHGNITILAGASYFIPVVSAALAAMLLNTPLSLSFWQGAALVCTGSTLCWLASHTRKLKKG